MYIILHIDVILMDISTVLSPYAFSICDTSGPEYKDYEYGGIGRQIKTSSSLFNFVSYKTLIRFYCVVLFRNISFIL